MTVSRVFCRLAPGLFGVAIIFAAPNFACGKGEGGDTGKTSASINGGGKTATNDRVPGAAEPPDRGPERTLYSLIDNRLAAHSLRNGGLAIPAGSAGFVKYLRWRRTKLSWNVRHKHDGALAAAMTGKVGRFHVPLTGPQAKGSVPLRMRAFNAKQRALTVRINGNSKRELTSQISEGWSTITVDVPEGMMRAGENEIILFTGKGAPMVVEWIHIGGDEAIEQAPRFYDAGSNSLVLPDGGGLAYYVMVPENARLVGEVAGKGCRVSVTATTDGGKRATGELPGKDWAVSLGGLAGEVARVELLASGCPEAKLAGAALVVSGQEPEVKRGEPPKHVILWIMDSLRSDRVRAFNPKARPEAPTFDALAKSGAAFLQHYVQGNESRVSHASIWSALYPVKHNMLKPKAKLAKKWTTIEEVARKAGMFTSGVSANGYADPKWGIGEAWNKFSNHIHAKKGLRGADVVNAALKTVEGKTDPWFLYIGTIDTHVSWRPKKPWIDKYHPAKYTGRFAKRFSGTDAGKAAGGKLKMSKGDIEWVRALYDSNVSYQDDLLAQVLAKLEEWGIRDQTMIIITADHGDEQWEDGRVGHGQTLLDSLVHVPLLIHYPPMIGGGKIAEGAEVIDIVPTLADALGVDPSDAWQGRSLIPLTHGRGAGYPRMSMATNKEASHVARIAHWKLSTPGSGKPRLSRAGETVAVELQDVTSTHPFAFRFVSDPLWLLRANNAGWAKTKWGNAANTTAAFPKSLGE